MNNQTKHIHVAVGVITNPQKQILIAKRAANAHQGGLWEFPGGKVEAGEAVTDALARELFEELAIKPTACRFFMDIVHDYPDKTVRLDIWTVSEFTGEPSGAEGQVIRWVALSELADYEFPKANVAIIDKLLKSSEPA